MTRTVPLIGLALAGLLLGCADDLTPGSSITRNRVIGARAAVVGDPERAWPRAGEEVEVGFLVVDPGPRRPLTWAFVACPLADAAFGADSCGGDPFAFVLSLDPVVGAPTFVFEVPSEDALDGAAVLAVLGVICADGLPSTDLESDDGCVGDRVEETIVAFTLPVSREAVPNRHPRIGAIELGGVPWTYEPALDAPVEGCSGVEGIPRRRSTDVDVPIFIDDAAGSQETFVVEEGDPPREVEDVEDLQISHFTDLGELDRQFSFIEGDVPDATVDWNPPEEIEEIHPDGSLVRSHFVMRDGRGGVDWATRAFCLVR